MAFDASGRRGVHEGGAAGGATGGDGGAPDSGTGGTGPGPGRRRRLFRWILALSLLGLLAGAGGGVAFYAAFLTDLPDLETIADYRPPLTTRVVDRDEELVGEFYNERRQLVPLEQIPRHAQLAFVAAEDSAFFEHSGIDYVSILRAAWVDLTAGEIRQGASTITMQLVKQLLLSPERRFRRKIREMILARRLEQHFTKEEILYLYLSHIYFGHGAHGIAEAARTYFDKDVAELEVGESALLAGLPQRPSAYSPYRDPESAERRRQYVLRRMFSDGVIDEAAYEEARNDPPELRPPEARERYTAAAYFTEEVRRYLYERLGGETVLDGGLLVETTLDLDLQEAAVEAVHTGLHDHDKRQGYRGPLRRVKGPEAIEEEILAVARTNGLLPEEDEEAEADPEGPPGAAGDEAAPDAEASAAESALDDLADGNEPEEGPAVEEELAAIGEEGSVDPMPGVPFDEPLEAVVVSVDRKGDRATVAFGPEQRAEVRLEDVEWARKADPSSRPRTVAHIERIFAVGDVARFLRLPDEVPESEDGADPEAEAPPPLARATLFQEPLVEGALLSLDLPSGDVLAMVGGYDFERSQFNRVTQASRQPGSAFKPFIYGAALSRNHTPVDILYDRPVVYEDPVSGFVWRPQNYSRHFFGPLPMRTALVRSVNNATVHLFRDVGVDYVIDYARRLGIQSPLSRDLSLALGSSGTTLLELTSAYAVFPNKGRRVLPRFIRRVLDRDGEVLLEDVPLGPPPPPVLRPLEEENAEASASYPDGEILPTEQVISEVDAFLMCDLLMAVVNDPRGTGWRLKRLRREVGGKTGTTNDQADAWFMGFSPTITTGVWVGHDESRVLGWGETGSRAAAPIWVDYMEAALAGREKRGFEIPKPSPGPTPDPDGPQRLVEFVRIDRSTGLLADGSGGDAYWQPFKAGTEPTESTSAATSASDARRALREDAF